MSNDISPKYDPKDLEDKWYKYWSKNGYFSSNPNSKESYTIVMPPPNVTGILHMGHILNNTIQDVLIRKARMKGFNACWVPGTDHASIATEAKVVNKLKEEGIDKKDISRQEFLKYAWEWKETYGGIILEQLKKLGASCDWNRIKFTMDHDMNESVIKVFVDLYNKGIIYRGYRMVNWDPEAKTTISDEEVVYVEKQSKLYYLKYKIEGKDDFLIIATTRPETILGDVAICINPNDQRYKHLVGKKVIVPICNRIIPIIQDEYVDMDFGTGCLKITPAHDLNDKLLGDKYNLEVIDILNDDATLNHFGLHYEGKDRFIVRREIVKELNTKGYLFKEEDYKNKIGTSERTGAVIEPRISKQWFLKMDKLVKPALENVMNGSIRIFPEKFKNTYKHWMENVIDWNISRQLWWGHRIPVYYYGEGENDYVVANTEKEALELIKIKTGENKSILRQEEDVLDTWFSSWLWPVSVFNGIVNPENLEMKYYYPTQDLVTGPDILFFWVARMVIAGYEYLGDKPFKNIYLTGIVKDKSGRKMSKSLGNSPDPMELINEYGADSVRMGMLLVAPAGNDLPFDVELCNQGRNFCNKIWNAFRLIKSWEVVDMEQNNSCVIAVKWMKNRFLEYNRLIEKSYDNYRISESLMAIYKLTWDEFCSWYLEIIKPEYKKPIDNKTFNETVTIFEDLLKLLHPFMPFITEELWQSLSERKVEEALIVTKYPEKSDFDDIIIKNIEFIKEIIASIRNIRKEKNITNKENITIKFINKENITNNFIDIVKKLANVSTVEEVSEKQENSFSFRVKSDEYFIMTHNMVIDIEQEKQKLKKELKYMEGFLENVRKKLTDENFIKSAPINVINIEKKKEKDSLEKIEILEKSLKNLY